MKTNDLKKGTAIILANGWRAEIADNMRGNRRKAKVYGIETETGSVYSHDIVRAFVEGDWVDVEHTPAQVKLRKQVSMW
jgi:hypothetical protein